MSARRAIGFAVSRPLRSSIGLHGTCSSLAARSVPFRLSASHVPAGFGYRHASTDATSSAGNRLRNILYGTTFAAVLFAGYYAVTDVRFSAHQWLTVPLLRWIYQDAEGAHHAGVKGLKAMHQFGLHARERGDPDAAGDLSVEAFGHRLANPIGTSAGIDKGAEVPDELLLLGSAWVEVGGITPLPQDGNPRPRLFRIPSQNALINRFGLNSEGADHVAMRLRKRVRKFAYSMGLGMDEEAERKVLDGEAGVPPGSLVKGKLMGVQIAKNKNTSDDIDAVARDYVYCVEKLSKYADVIVVNVSSPNTENLRDLQRQEPLTKLLTAVVSAARRTDRKTKPAVMVKVSPDEDSTEQVEGICEAIWDSGVDGVIVGNTTRRRPDALPAGVKLSQAEEVILKEQGGYSGPQLFERTVSLVKKYRQILDQHSDGRRPAILAGDDLKSLPREAADSTVNDLSLKTADDAPAEAPFHLPKAGTSNTSKATDARDPVRKVIFCSGGITNGKQALEALNAGADMVQVYTA
jgi:dihydroorotate dehydrogenase